MNTDLPTKLDEELDESTGLVNPIPTKSESIEDKAQQISKVIKDIESDFDIIVEYILTQKEINVFKFDFQKNNYYAYNVPLLDHFNYIKYEGAESEVTKKRDLDEIQLFIDAYRKIKTASSDQTKIYILKNSLNNSIYRYETNIGIITSGRTLLDNSNIFLYTEAVTQTNLYPRVNSSIIKPNLLAVFIISIPKENDYSSDFGEKRPINTTQNKYLTENFIYIPEIPNLRSWNKKNNFKFKSMFKIKCNNSIYQDIGNKKNKNYLEQCFFMRKLFILSLLIYYRERNEQGYKGEDNKYKILITEIFKTELIEERKRIINLKRNQLIFIIFALTSHLYSIFIKGPEEYVIIIDKLAEKYNNYKSIIDKLETDKEFDNKIGLLFDTLDKDVILGILKSDFETKGKFFNDPNIKDVKEAVQNYDKNKKKFEELKKKEEKAKESSDKQLLEGDYDKLRTVERKVNTVNKIVDDIFSKRFEKIISGISTTDLMDKTNGDITSEITTIEIEYSNYSKYLKEE